MALAAAGFLTAFYIARQICLVFMGDARSDAADFNLPVAALSTLIALAGIGLAYMLYRTYRADDPLSGWLFNASTKAWWVDEVYAALILQPYHRLTHWMARLDVSMSYSVDRAFIALARFLRRLTTAAEFRVFEGVDRGSMSLATTAANWLRKTQTGQLNWNVAGVIGGLIVVLLLAVLGRGV